MQSFLYEVARSLYSDYGDEIGELTLLFPSRRARIFFTDALSQIAQKPIWQPRWMSLDDLISQASDLVAGEKIRLITELYKIYSKHHTESFDRFYFWGEVLLADFDMVDKYAVDADKLFRNINDIKELEADISYMTPEQLKIIRFWASLGDEQDLSLEKRRFLKIWQSLSPIYKEYRSRLLELGLAYTGMIQRQAVERIKSGEFSFESDNKYVVVGFNALSECEKEIFKALEHSADVQFFWDYDNYYVENRYQEAGLFLRSNVKMFPPKRAVSTNNFALSKSIRTIATASNALQCKYVAEIIKEIAAKQGSGVDKRTAIVLTDENLLMPLLYSLPSEAGRVNVTMGYPLRQTIAYSFVERLIELQSHSRVSSTGRVTFYHIDVVGLLSHPYLASADESMAGSVKQSIMRQRMISVDRNFLMQSDLMSLIYTNCLDWSSMSQYLLNSIAAVAKIPYEGEDAQRRVEFLAYISDHISQLENSIKACDVELSITVYISLLRRQLQSLRIPFEGEPLEGVQVMGILETRNLDFENIIVLSMNDDNFPGNRSLQPSYIPYNLRSAYALPTPEHHEGVFGYYFYRLVQRASNVWLLYCSRADDKSTGEASRYIHQLDYESQHQLEKLSVGVDVNSLNTKPIIVKKDGQVAEQLSRFLDPKSGAKISPTAFNRYINCPLQFYFYSIAKVREEDELSESVDAPMFGTIMHATMKELYEPLIGRSVAASKLAEYLEGATIQDVVDKAIADEFFKDNGGDHEYSGDLILVRDVVVKYVRTIIKYDIAHPDFVVDIVEDDVDYSYTLESGQQVRFAGIADRVDRLSDNKLRVIDYKSGAEHLEFKSIPALFADKSRSSLANTTQTLLYSMMLSRKRLVDVEPNLYYARVMNSPTYEPQIIDASKHSPLNSYRDCADEFEQELNSKLGELFDFEQPFVQCEDVETCKYCTYKAICNRSE